MIVLSGITIQSKIYECSASLVYRGIREEDGREIVIKLLKAGGRRQKVGGRRQ